MNNHLNRALDGIDIIRIGDLAVASAVGEAGTPSLVLAAAAPGAAATC